ncbi:MAG: hypothetical protein PHG02_05090 [Oscillospiraceae bacterium]|nr:hypothetical protein [Oscillospiraceae bacterium]
MKKKILVRDSIVGSVALTLIVFSLALPGLFAGYAIPACWGGLVALGWATGNLLREFILWRKYPAGLPVQLELLPGQKLSTHSKAFLFGWGVVIFSLYFMASFPAIFGFINNYAVGFLFPFCYSILYAVFFIYFDNQLKNPPTPKKTTNKKKK